MRGAGQTSGVRHLRHLLAAHHAAHVANVGLHDVHGVHGNHVLPHRQVAILLTTGHVDRQGLTHGTGLLQLPVGAGFLKMADAIGFQHPAHLNGARR